MAVGSGVMIMVAQISGRRTTTPGDSIGNSVTLILILSVIITGIATPLTAAMLRACNTPPETFEMARVFLQILFIGAAGNGFYNILSGILRGLGESVFRCLCCCCRLLNAALELWFVPVLAGAWPAPPGRP
jgi:Na+-driven multidrug efflux pump